MMFYDAPSKRVLASLRKMAYAIGYKSEEV